MILQIFPEPDSQVSKTCGTMHQVSDKTIVWLWDLTRDLRRRQRSRLEDLVWLEPDRATDVSELCIHIMGQRTCGVSKTQVLSDWPEKPRKAHKFTQVLFLSHVPSSSFKPLLQQFPISQLQSPHNSHLIIFARRLPCLTPRLPNIQSRRSVITVQIEIACAHFRTSMQSTNITPATTPPFSSPAGERGHTSAHSAQRRMLMNALRDLTSEHIGLSPAVLR